MGRTRQVTSEKRRANKALRAGDGGKAADAGADTQRALPERRRPLGEEHGRAADGGNSGSETE